MAPWALEELEALVEREMPEGACITSSRFAEPNIVLCIALPTTVRYPQLEALRQQWERHSSWRIAIDTLYHSPGLTPQLIETVLQIAPARPEVKGVLSQEKRLIIYTTNVPRLFGRDNKVLLRLHAALPGREVSVQSADPRNWSANLEEVDGAITQTLDCTGVLGEARQLAPAALHLRSVTMEVPTRTLTLKYGTPRAAPADLAALRQEVTRQTGWNVAFREVIDEDTLVRQVKRLLPPTLPRTEVGFIPEGQYLLLSCFGDLTHEPILIDLTQRLSRELPVDVRYKIKLRDERKGEIIADLAPADWGFQKASYNDKEQTAVLNCTHPPHPMIRLPEKSSPRSRSG
jgi:hypothetical protein